MVTIVYSDNINDKEFIVNGNTVIGPDGVPVTKDHDITLAEVCDMAGFDKRRHLSLNGDEMSYAALNVTPAQLGLSGRVFLMALAKTDNA